MARIWKRDTARRSASKEDALVETAAATTRSVGEPVLDVRDLEVGYRTGQGRVQAVPTLSGEQEELSSIPGSPPCS